MTYGIYTYILVYIHILLRGSMKKKKVSEQEDVVLMYTERGLSKSSPISKRIINDILVEEFLRPNVIFLSRLSLRSHVAQPLFASKLRSSQDVVLMEVCDGSARIKDGLGTLDSGNLAYGGGIVESDQ